MPGASSQQIFPMVAATDLVDGAAGIVPKPVAGDQYKLLNGSGIFVSPKARNYDDVGGGSSFSDSLSSLTRGFQSNVVFIGGKTVSLTSASSTVSNSFLSNSDFANNTVIFADAKLSMVKNDGTVISGATRSCIIRKDNSGVLTLDYHPAAVLASAIVSAFAFSAASSSPTIEFTTGAAGSNFKWAIEVKYTALTLS